MKKAELQELVPELLKFFNDYIYHQFEISAEGIPVNADEYRITPEHIRLLADSGEKRTACFAKLGLEPFEHTRTTRGETISSSDTHTRKSERSSKARFSTADSFLSERRQPLLSEDWKQDSVLSATF